VGSNWFTGSLSLDTDGDGSTNLVSFTAVDVDGDDEVDLLEITSDDSTFGEGTLDDSTTGSDDDERIDAGSGSSTSQNVVLGEYTFLVSFDHQQSEAGVSVSVQSGSWFTGQFTIDADADGVADNAVNFALSDSDSNGIYDRLDLSSDDVILGEEQVESPTPSLTNAQTGVDDDERITGSSSIRLGANYTFTVDFEPNPAISAQDASITSKTWYTGTFEADTNDDGSDEPLDFVVLDSDSNGLYDTLELDADDSGVYGSDESVVGASDTLTVGDVQVSFEFEINPADDATVALVVESEAPPDASSFLGFNDPVESAQQVLELPAVDSGESGSALTASELGALLGELLGQVVELNLDSGTEITDEAFGDLLAALSEQNEEFQEQVAAVDVPPVTISPVPSRIGLDLSGQWFVWDEVVITLDFSVEDPDLRIAQIAALTGGEVVGSSPGGRIYQIRYTLENRDDLGDLRGLTDRFPGVTSASRHYLIDPEGPFSKVPDDSVFSEWDVGNPDGNNWNLEFMNAPAAWDITTGSDKVFVGVIDGAMDSGHSDLIGNVASTFGPFSAIANGHGTHVSGIICADGNNGQGITGVAWDCSLRVFDFGARSPVLATDAMIRAVDQGASIINISLQWVDNSQCGTRGTSPTLKKVQETNAIFGRAIEYARKQNKDVLWVIAAGNECRDTKYASPASLVEKFPQDVVVVGSIDRDGGLSSFSNYGDLVDVAAPGGGILSTLPRTCAANEAGDLVCKDEYGVKSGTSMAAPHVSGLAVLIRSAHPEFNARRVKACIVNFATRPVQSHNFNIIDAEKSVQCGETDEVTAPNIPTPPPSNNGGGGQRRPFGGR
jgi:subtilisin family serine protease